MASSQSAAIQSPGCIFSPTHLTRSTTSVSSTPVRSQTSRSPTQRVVEEGTNMHDRRRLRRQRLRPIACACWGTRWHKSWRWHHGIPDRDGSRSWSLQTGPPRTVPERSSRSPAWHDRKWRARTRQTAQQPKPPLGLAEITHPFHPLRGQQFAVLKLRTVSGVELLSLRPPDLGSLWVAPDCTDWAAPGMNPPAPHLALIIDADGLLTLSDLVDALSRNSFESNDSSGVDS